MYWDVKIVKPLSDYRLYIEIEDGRKGIFDVRGKQPQCVAILA